MNDSTREMIAKIKADQQAKAAAAKQAKEAKALAKRLLKEAKIKRLEAFRIQRDRENRQAILDRRSRPSSVNESDEPASRPKRSLPPDKLSQVGERIPGSSLVRDFCVSCGEAMRVIDAGRPNTCLDCKPTGCPGSVSDTIVSETIEYHGGRFHSAEW